MINNTTFLCAVCRKIKPIEYLKGSLKNDDELQRLISENSDLILKLADLDIREADALQGKIDGSMIKRNRELIKIRLRGIDTRIKNFSGLLVCVSDWNRGRAEAQEARGLLIKFTCGWCNSTVSGKKYWCHVVNGLDKDINPWIAIELCKSCWLNEVVPNDKVNYCPRLGSDGEETWSSGDKYDCQCKAKGKMEKDREGGYKDTSF